MGRRLGRTSGVERTGRVLDQGHRTSRDLGRRPWRVRRSRARPWPER
jgi:hypothetical protein